MALSEADIEQIIDLVRSDPHLRDRLRDAIVGDDFLALPGLVRQLVDHGHEVDRRLDQLTERMDQLAGRMDQLAARMDAFTVTMLNMEGRLGNVEGQLFEDRLVKRLPERLGRRFRAVKAVSPALLDELVAADDSGLVTPAQWDDVMLLDACAWATDKTGAEPTRVLVAVEISIVVDDGDVSRAHRRAAVLKSVGLPAIAVVDGRTILENATRLATSLGVVSVVPKPPPPE